MVHETCQVNLIKVTTDNPTHSSNVPLSPRSQVIDQGGIDRPNPQDHDFDAGNHEDGNQQANGPADPQDLDGIDPARQQDEEDAAEDRGGGADDKGDGADDEGDDNADEDGNPRDELEEDLKGDLKDDIQHPVDQNQVRGDGERKY